MQRRLEVVGALVPERNGSTRNNGSTVLAPTRVGFRSSRKKGFFLGTGGLRSTTSLNTYLQTLAGINLPPIIKAQDPFTWHPWIFSAAMTVATVASSAPYTIFTETEDEQERRRARARARGRAWRGGARGKQRRALLRHLRVPLSTRLKKLSTRGLEPDEEHPLWEPLLDPNPYMNGKQLFWLTHLWLAMRSHVMWVLTDENGEDPLPGDIPARIWPMSPDFFEPILEFISHGEQVAWRFKPTILMKAREKGEEVVLPLTSVIEFKLPHPMNHLQGVSRVAATVLGVEQDLALGEYDRSVVENDGDPGGVVMMEEQMQQKEEQEWLLRWEQRHEGPHNKRRTALLSGGMKYMPIALTPLEMQGREQREWHRAEHLAAMGVAPSQLGVTEFTNYATALGQKKDLWDNTILPQTNLVDEVLENSVLFETEPDTVVGQHDLRDVEALRSGITEKTEIAKVLAEGPLHVTPRAAFNTVGLEVEEYEGDDVSIVPATMATLDDVMSGALTMPAPGGAPPPFGEPEEDPEENPFEDPDDEEVPEEEEEASGPRVVTTAAAARAQYKSHRTDDFIVAQSPHEAQMRARYLRWIRAEKAATLRRFDNTATEALSRARSRPRSRAYTKQFVNLDDVVPNLRASQQALRSRVRPLFSPMLETTFEFTLSELGIPLFTIDEPAIMSVLEAREANLVLNTPVTVRNNLLRSLTQGITNGETLTQLRQRIGEVYGISGSSSRSLTIARTETAGFMNTARDEMFKAQGVEKGEWSTAGDEVVRSDHQIFGGHGPEPIGFNFMTLVAGGGVLEHPHDPRAVAGQVVNCRCLWLPL